MTTNPRIIFMGTRGLAETVLERLIQSRIWAPILVVAQPDRPVGRKQTVEPVPVKTIAQRYGIPVWQPETLKDQAAVQRIASERPDCIIVASYGKLIPETLIVIPPHGVLNVHASLLPKYRGASPIQRAILAGDLSTGVTLMRIDEGLDTGDIVAQKSCPIERSETLGTFLPKLAELGSSLLLETLPDWFAGTITPRRQVHSEATVAPLFTKQDGRIDAKMKAVKIERMIRALAPWPGTYLILKGGRKLALQRASPVPCSHGEQNPLSLHLTADKKLALHTIEGCLILEEVQPEGKKPMSGYDFYLGNKNNL